MHTSTVHTLLPGLLPCLGISALARLTTAPAAPSSSTSELQQWGLLGDEALLQARREAARGVVLPLMANLGLRDRSSQTYARA